MSDGHVGSVSDKKRAHPSSDEIDYLLENDVIDIDTLKQFTIPKKKTHKHDTLTRVEMSSPESRELIRIVHQSFKDRDSVDCFVYSRPRIVNNVNLLDKFMDRKKNMKHSGYSDKELHEAFAFLFFDDDLKAVKVCSEGVQINNSNLTCLGDPKMGVYLCKHADIISPKPLKNKTFGTLLVLKLIKGRVKLLSESRSGVSFDPTPNFDCHIFKSSNIDLASTSLQLVFESTQLYVYEYTEDSDISKQPGQIVPYALLNFRYEKSSKSMNLIGSPSLKQNRLEKKQGIHSSHSDKKSQKLQTKESNTVGSSAKEGEPHAYSKQALVPFNEYQVWTGSLLVSELSLGCIVLNSASLLVDLSILGSEIRIKEKVPLAYLKSFVLKNFTSLEKRKENVSDDLSVTCATLYPAFSNYNFNLFVDHLIETEMVGYVVLLDCSEVFILPSASLKEYGNLMNGDHEKNLLSCLFVSKDGMSARMQGYVERKISINMIRNEAAYNADKEARDQSNFAEAPASPEPEQSSSSVNMRDPRLRFKSKASKQESDSVSKHSFIVGTSRLLSLFEHMSDIQDKTNVEIARRSNLSSKNQTALIPNVLRQDSHSEFQGNQRGPGFKPPEAIAEASSKVPPSFVKQVVATVPEAVSVVPTNSPSLDLPAPALLSTFKLPEIASAIADPKVSQLLEDLKSKNIIGLGTSPHSEGAAANRGIDLFGSIKTGQSSDSLEQKRLGRVDPRLAKMQKNGGDSEVASSSSNRVPPLMSDVLNLHPSEINKNEALIYPEVSCSEIPGAPLLLPNPRGSYSPVEVPGPRSGLTNPNQFSDPRRRYGSFLPDPKSFQKNFFDGHQQRPPKSFSNKSDPRLGRSRFTQPHMDNR